jgi:hypothetical protein
MGGNLVFWQSAEIGSRDSDDQQSEAPAYLSPSPDLPF